MGRAFDLLRNMTIEDKILIYCTRDERSSGRNANIAECLKARVDWENMILRSVAHGVDSFLYYVLKAIDSGSVPSEVLQRLERLYLTKLSRNMIQSAELGKILQAMEEQGTEIVLLKGAFLDEKIYSMTGFRGFSDMDLLVRKADVSSAVSVLEKLGYTLIAENIELAKSEGRTQLHYQKANAFLVDLHWEAMNNKWYSNVTRYFADNIWQNATLTKFNGANVWILAHEDLLIYQCMHLSIHHNFHMLIWFKDIDEVICSRDDIDWALLVDKAKKYGLSTYCYYSLCFTKELLGSPIPTDVLSALRPKSILSRVFEAYLKKENILDIADDRRGRAQQIWMVLRDSSWSALFALRWRVFPSIHWYIQSYPFLPKIKESHYYPFYPLLMILRLVYRPVDQIEV